ncbi:MAG: S41 family peptidase, partial [Planctomycetota bacterium]
SEIVSGAIRDNHRGTVIGERTFGKFSVQNLIPLSSSNAKLKITTSRYYLPSGVSLHREPTSEKWGVEPEIPIRLARWERYNAFQLRRDADLLGPPKPATKVSDAEKPVDLSKIDPLTGEEGGPETKRDAEIDAAKADTSNDGAAKNADGKTADADAPKADELPPLEQPDENNRPKEDPQVDTALLFMRVKLLGILHPTLADAERPVPRQTAQP